MFKSIKNNYFFLISIFLILYFFFNLLSGERGLISYLEKKQTLKNLETEELLRTLTDIFHTTPDYTERVLRQIPRIRRFMQ